MLFVRDDLGETWTFDGWRVYCLAAEEEMVAEGRAHENGYPCRSWEEAIQILNEGGYISGAPKEAMAKFATGDSHA